MVGLFLVWITASAFGQTMTPTPTATTIEIQIWWPDDLAGFGEMEIRQHLEDEIRNFNASDNEYELTLRLKPHRGPGSILTTLNAATPVASEGFPHLVLLSRADLIAAVPSGWVYPIDDWVPDVLRGDLITGTESLGIVNDQLYGMPYALNLQHAVYRPSGQAPNAPQSFTEVLEIGSPLLFAGRPIPNQAVNTVLLAQYLQAGGSLVNPNGQPDLEETPLRQILAYYAQGVEAELFTPDLGGYVQPSDYWVQFESNEIPFAIVDSRTILREGLPASAQTSTIPSETGEPLVILDGWLWALTTDDLNAQRGALAFMNYMMATETLADDTHLLDVVPARQRSLRLWENQAYAALVREWVPEALILPISQINNPASVELQEAFIAILGGASPAEATRQALSALETTP